MLDTKKYQTELEAQLKTISDELTNLGTYDPVNDNWEAIPDREDQSEADENSEADDVEDWNERRATLATLEIEYRDIKRALQKIATSQFGSCEIGGEPIEEERLEAKPTARTCIAHMNEEGQLSL